MDLIKFLYRMKSFSEKTFGPGLRVDGIINHIYKELEEVKNTPNDITEWMDLVILSLDGAWRSGHTPEEIVAALEEKQTKNENRQWPDWKTAEPGKAIEHIRA